MQNVEPTPAKPESALCLDPQVICLLIKASDALGSRALGSAWDLKLGVFGYPLKWLGSVLAEQNGTIWREQQGLAWPKQGV